ncbi:DUF366 family protein [Desulfofundulus thermobenzoicus]|uniref:DUF366 family protein n=1 Tax=Desulfofundulus thermobenzoicus TaxID=29376 RepID=A0A6N7ITJ3_9FIRM|nr:DUF366 family protein [Desulfofundulus thermobenzoicus]MQL53372.1 DUF366 family protein [Desulfofundulus thermobenzoicus]HHW43687.1 DUF366 family protein [Desulfotomaculum sp.]
MHVHFVPDTIIYDGTQLSSLWAYRTFGLLGDSIVSFRGPCRLDFNHMVDVEDVLARSPIYGEDMLHFIVEHFDGDLEKTVTRQRLLVVIIKEILEEKGITLKRSGDDLYHHQRKLSISIATATPISTMIHTALNVTAKDTPIPATGLVELGYAAERVPALAREIGQAYAAETASIHRARCKVRGVG